MFAAFLPSPQVWRLRERTPEVDNMGWPFRPMASEPTILEPAAALEPSILVHWLSLYIGCVVCMLGIVVTRQAYKLSPGFQARLAATGFHQLAMDAPVADKARVT